MTDVREDHETSGGFRLSRRGVLAAGVGAVVTASASATPATATPTGAVANLPFQAAPGAIAAVPPSVRSRQEVLAQLGADVAALPITQNGTTYNYAQVVRWLDDEHFVVGRWDGTMSVFDFETAPFVGPVITEAVNSPSAQGVRMITELPGSTLVSSGDDRSLALWKARGGNWRDLRLVETVGYDPALGAATSGALFATGRHPTLVVGHDAGQLSLWSYRPSSSTLRLSRVVDVRNPSPVNPWDLHTIYGLAPLTATSSDATVVAGSDDGYVSIVRVPSGTILAQTVFNPSAQRGINSVSVLGDKLLVANCSVGADDHNLWYFTVDRATGALTLVDKMNLIIDPAEVQSFNFDTTWGRYAGGPCWFAGTEEGALWMGTAGDTGLELIGYQGLGDGAIGAALAFAGDTGRLAAVIQNLFQFTTT